TQRPRPLHEAAGVNVEPLHIPAAHGWLPPNLRHAPVPSHVPSLPHDSGCAAAQSSAGSAPESTGAQVPSATPVESCLHAMHGPSHAVSQQTPSRLQESPARHAPLDGQGAPFAALTGSSTDASATRSAVASGFVPASVPAPVPASWS